MSVRSPTYPDVSDIRRLVAKDRLTRQLGHYLLSITLDTWEKLVRQEMETILPSMLPDIIKSYAKKGIEL